MFWKVSSFSSGSAIEGILDKQQVTLEELLEEDEMVQVARNLSASSRCLSWVRTPVLTCIHYIVSAQDQEAVLMTAVCTVHLRVQAVIPTACKLLMQTLPSG